MTGTHGGADLQARPEWRWDVALSFAGAQRSYVEQVAQVLKARGVRCFYDADEQIELWGKYLAEELPVIYAEQAAAVVVFLSAEYTAQDWTRLERRAALTRAVQERREFVLPARFDDTQLPGLMADMGTVDLRNRTAQEFATMIVGKLVALGIAAPAAWADLAGPARDAGAGGEAKGMSAGEGDLRWRGVHPTEVKGPHDSGKGMRHAPGVGSINYWVKISQRDESLGAGFILTSHLALTSSHCLKRIDRADSLLKLCFAGGEEVAGRVREYAEGANLALIDILEPLDGTLIPPASGRATEGDTWSAPYRPSTGDPHLNGQVVRGSIRYTCEAGAEIEALQLSCSQRIGDYSRYSGGPVERHLAGEVTLLGVLLEPYPDQQTAHRASDVLFAATIEEAGRRFKCLSAPHLLEFLSLSDGTSHEQFPARVSSQDDTGLLVQQANNNAFASPPLEQRIAAARSVLSALHELGISGVLDPLYVSKQKKRIVRRLVDSVWADENE